MRALTDDEMLLVSGAEYGGDSFDTSDEGMIRMHAAASASNIYYEPAGNAEGIAAANQMGWENAGIAQDWAQSSYNNAYNGALADSLGLHGLISDPSYLADLSGTSSLDQRIDAASMAVTDQIGSMSDVATREYGAIIWEDTSGSLHTTDIVSGSATLTPLDKAWGQVDFAHGGQVVAEIHSHPTMYNYGSDASPNFQPVKDSDFPSGADFDHLMTYVTPQNGYDAANFRQYLVVDNGNNVDKYIAADQNSANIGRPLNATWAVASNTYDQNTANQ